MRIHALPLRILLALALVLNGIGGAVAGVLMALPEATSHCGSQAEGASLSPDDAPIPGPGGHCAGDADCGDTPECRQACMHASMAVPPPLFGHAFQLPGIAILHPMACSHPAPALPSPMRPPIA